MATLREIIRQAISDFNGIENAIEECGVDVPYDTDTSEYGNLIRQLHANDTTETKQYVDERLLDYVEKADGERLFTDEEASLLKQLSETTTIGSVKLNGVELPMSEDRAVNIPIAGNSIGLVKSAKGENRVSVDMAGRMSVKSVNVNTLVQTIGDELVLNGGYSK